MQWIKSTKIKANQRIQKEKKIKTNATIQQQDPDLSLSSESGIRITQLDVLKFECIAFQEWFQSLSVDFEFITILGVHNLYFSIEKDDFDYKRPSPVGS